MLEKLISSAKRLGLRISRGGWWELFSDGWGVFMIFTWVRYSGIRGVEAKKNPANAGVFRSSERVVGCGLRSNSC